MNKEQRDAVRLTDDDLNDLSWSAYEEAMAFGMSRDVFLRYFKTIRERALLSDAAPQEPCFCDRQGLGEPGVSCGDCPTRDYKAAQPATPDAGTVLSHEDVLALRRRLGTSHPPSAEDIRAIEREVLSRVQAVRKPLTESLVRDLFSKLHANDRAQEFSSFNWFTAGVTIAEQAHGITGEQP